MGNETEKKKKNKAWLILALVLLAIAVICGAVCIYQYMQKKANEKAMQELTEATKPDESTQPETEAESKTYTYAEKVQYFKDTYGIDVPEKNIDFDDLTANTNPDIYAWIVVPNTKVDYPVLQHAEEADYYLMRNLDGSTGYPGCLYTDDYNAKDFSDRMTVIYGHNMKDGTMFKGLHKFEDSEFFDANPYFFIYTPDDVKVYKIFAAHRFSNTNLVLNFDWTVDGIFLNFLNEMVNDNEMGANTRPDTEFSADSKVVTLSTCVANDDAARYIVQGVELAHDWQ